MKVPHLNTRPPRVEMLPLIDIVFLLLVVFIYTMLSMAVHKGLPVVLPSGDEVQTEKKALISVTMTAEGNVSIDQRPVSLNDLSAELHRVSRNDRERGVLLFADRRVAYGELFSVLDRIHQAGLYRVSLQAESEVRP
jgi:biopolymer transport protein ExbD